jgi:NADH-quinone oxidoreductase subunit J
MFEVIVLLTLFFLCFFFGILHESVFVSVFFLISLFLVSSFIFILSGFEFIGFLYLIVYVGAVAVLFLFMVMLFDKSEYLFFIPEKKLTLFNKWAFILVSIYLFDFFNFVLLEFLVSDNLGNVSSIVGPSIYLTESVLVFFNNLEAIGSVLYSYFILEFLGAGIILLLGMVGAIVLTQMVPLNITMFKHQDIKSQVLRKRV